MDQSTLIQIAFSLYSNKGAYALLLGSGVSRAAGIPTGWEITIEMIRQIASLHGEDCGPDPEKWYLSKFGSQPGYSDLLDRLGKTATERNAFIKTFIEPSDEERSEGKKLPTAAHQAIARLVSSGIIKVIITTNFDRLLERAIEEQGIVPTVIASADAAVGATPMIHSACTIIKLNGDYLDTRSKNTSIELLQYDNEIVHLVERIFDEFGLIICGWSGDWDLGLCSLIEKIKGRRYSCYWAIKNALSDKAKALAELRSSIQIEIPDANSFFSALEEKISAVAELRRPHPLSPELAVVSLKKYVAEDKYRIKLHDLVMDEVNRVCNSIAEAKFPMTGMAATAASGQPYEERIHQYMNELSTLTPLIINGCWWGRVEHDELWIRAIERLANIVTDGGEYNSFRELRLFPAAYTMYAAGIAAISAKRFDLMGKLLHEPQVSEMNGQGKPLDLLFLQNVANPDYFPPTKQNTKRRTPLNDIVFDALKVSFSGLLPNSNDFEVAFDKFEYLFALVYGQVNEKERSQNGVEFVWVPPGRFAWKRKFDDHISKKLQKEIENAKDDWSPIKQGLLRGNYQSLLDNKKLVDNFSNVLGWSW